MCEYINKKVYFENKKEIHEFMNRDEFVAKFIFEEDSDRFGCAEIHVEYGGESVEVFVE
jgi:hypothetical protein